MWIQFSACAAESAGLTSDCTPDFERWADHLERSATSRGKHSRSRAWVQRFKKGGWTKRLFGAVICENYPPVSYHESTGSPGDILASLSAKQESGQGPTTRDTCGLRSSSLFGAIDPPACCLKTSRAISRWGCSMSCPTWKATVTERRGAVTRRRLSALHTDANESSSSGWPTPTVGDSRGAANATANRRPGAKFNSGRTLTDAMHTVAVESSPDSQAHLVGSSSTNLRAQLNPDWVEMLMGFPIGWTDCAPSGTQ